MKMDRSNRPLLTPLPTPVASGAQGGRPVGPRVNAGTSPVIPRSGAPRAPRATWLQDLPLFWKLLLGYGAVLLLMALAGSWAAWQLRQQDTAYRQVLAGEAHSATLAQEMRATLL